MNRDRVVLVDAQDRPIAEMDKIKAHVEGLLHRAFSIFILNSKGEMLLHQRAKSKYHGGGLWTNACCSHPQWNEDLYTSATERLAFEMGLICNLEKIFEFVYYTPVENGLIEHEYDHVFIGYTDEQPKPNADEVENYEWKSIETLISDIETNSSKYTYWFKFALPQVLAKIELKNLSK